MYTFNQITHIHKHYLIFIVAFWNK